MLDAREGGPAERAGIRSTKRDDSGRLLLGDVIVGIDNEKIEDSYDLYRALDTHAAGTRLKSPSFATPTEKSRFSRQVGRHQRHETAVDEPKIIRLNGRVSLLLLVVRDYSSNSSSSKGLGRGGRFEPLTPPTTR